MRGRVWLFLAAHGHPELYTSKQIAYLDGPYQVCCYKFPSTF